MMKKGQAARIKQAKSPTIEAAIQQLHEAVDTRVTISEHYRHYKSLSSIACLVIESSHNDIKRAVDALYYFGGGWPTENSKGRMESLLDNFAGMFKVMEFAGFGDMVTEHLAKQGISVTINEKFEDAELTENDYKYLTNEMKSDIFNVRDFKTRSDLVSGIIMELQDTQGIICKLADKIKLELKPSISSKLGIEDQEYDRLFDITRIVKVGSPKAKIKITDKKSKVETSISGFNKGFNNL
jgi:hypothetical protein